MKDITCAPSTGHEKEEALKHVIALMHGEDNVKSKFPMAYKAFNGKNGHRMLTTGYDCDDCRMQVLHVAYIAGDHGKILVRILIESAKKEGYDILTLSVLDKESGDVIAENLKFDFTGDNNIMDAVCPIKERNYKDVIIKAGLNKVTAGNEAYCYLGELTLGEFEIDIQGEFHIDDPVIKKEKGKDQINISYYNAGWYIFDYLYPDARKDGCLYIPFKGQIDVKNGDLALIDRYYLTVTYRKDSPRRYANAECPTPVGLRNMHTIAWEFNPNWKLPYNDILKELYTQVTCTLHIEAVTTDGNAVTFIITTDNSNRNLSERSYILPPIEIYKDCFVKGTCITLQNGMKIPVENVRKGDVVVCHDGSCSAITAISGTPSRQALGQLVLENGLELSTTLGHLIMTAEGLKPFVLLTEDDLVLTENGLSKIQGISKTPEQDSDIYVVSLDNGRTLMANGIAVSDSKTRLTDEEKKTNVRCMVPEKFRQDYDSWIEMEGQK